MLSMSFDHVVGRECLQTAMRSIDAICDFWSSYHNNADRYFCTIFLTGAIMPLSCIIVRPDSNGNRADAILSFQKALKLMEVIAEGFSLARKMIERLQSVIDVATRPAMLQLEDQNMLENIDRNMSTANDDQNFFFGQHRSQSMFSNVDTPAMGDFPGVCDGTESLGIDIDNFVSYQMLIPMG